jgi:hypothetical protein
MKNKLLEGGIAILIIGIVLISTGAYVIASDIKSTKIWTRMDGNFYKSMDIKINDESLLILSHGDVEFYLLNSSYSGSMNSTSLRVASIPPIETTDNEAIYDIDSGNYYIIIHSNYTPRASISYISIDVLIIYGVMALAGLVFFILGIIFIPMAIMSSRRNSGNK